MSKQANPWDLAYELNKEFLLIYDQAWIVKCQ